MTAIREIYGVLAEFDDAASLVRAARTAREEGYRVMDAYAPMPVEGLHRALGGRTSKLPWLVLACGVLGAIAGYALQVYSAMIAYPMNVGGRPRHSWPAFVPVTFEMTILFASLGAVLGMLALNGLPRPHHPLFHVERFDHASQDAFFLCIESADPAYDRARTHAFLESLEPVEVHDVPWF